MVNLEHKLTVDDLIVEYMAIKIENGYEPNLLTSEFIDFLRFFESKMEVQDSLYDGEALFKRFFERKNDRDWALIKNYSTMEKVVQPHMEFEYKKEHDDFLVSANYYFRGGDISIINTYFMNKTEVKKIRNIIKEYLQNSPKRKIDESVDINEEELSVGKHIAAMIIDNIWESYVSGLIKNHRWPIQCKSIDKYLFEFDLAEAIEVPTIKRDLLKIYQVFSKRIAIMYHQDENLEIDSTGSYLSKSNYDLLIEGYEHIAAIAFNQHGKSLRIDLKKSTFNESHIVEGVYFWDEDPEIKTTTTYIVNEDSKKLVKKLDTIK